MGNVYFDRATGERVVPNDQTTWHRSADWLRPAARTVFEMVAKHSPAGDGASGRRASTRRSTAEPTTRRWR